MRTSVKELDLRLSDRLPSDWRRRVSNYRGSSAAHFRRVMKTLEHFSWMSQDERERAAFVIVEKEQLREQGFVITEED